MIPKALTIEEIGEKLKNMIVGEGKYQPMAFVSFLVKNPNYDPTNFSQEISPVIILTVEAGDSGFFSFFEYKTDLLS